MRITALLLLSGCVAAPAAPRTPVSFTDNPAMPFQQARAICTPRAQAAARQARAQAELQLTTQPNVGGVQRTFVPNQAAKEAGDSAYSGCLAEQGWAVR